VVYTKPVKIVINVPHAAAGQCPVVDDFMHDFDAFEEPPSGETLVTEHNIYEVIILQDLLEQIYVFGASLIGIPVCVFMVGA
jgi:hypothetical protein